MIVGLRHARVWNPDGVVYARLPGFHLSEQGRVEAGEVATALSGAPVAAVHSSPLERAVETAEILARPHGLGVTIDDRLVEWAFWVRWQGLQWSRIRERDPQLLETFAHDPGSESLDEPLREAAERLLAWAAEAEAGGPDQALVIGVTHEAPLAAALRLRAGGGLGAFHATSLPHLGAVRLRPGPPEVIDLPAWARSC